MTNDEILSLYKEAYCSKEAGLGSFLVNKVGPAFTKISNKFGPYTHLPSKFFNNLFFKGRSGMNIPGWVWKQTKAHPIVPILGAGALGYYGYNQASNYYDMKKKDNPLYSISEWIKENPGLTAALAIGGITSPLWAPPVIKHLFGEKEKEGLQYGPATNRYQMGYYPG